MATTNQHPPGTLPKTLTYIVTSMIVAIIAVATMVSGKKTAQVAVAPASSGPNQSQLANFREILERHRREEAQGKQLPSAAPPRQHPLPHCHTTPSSDPIREKMRAREAAAPFASSRVFQAVPAESQPAIDRSSQVALSISKKGEESKGLTSTTEISQASGRLLPERVGGLYRIYEGTMITTRLRNRLDGTFTGPVVTVANHDTRSKDDLVVIVPAGTLFFGEATRVQAQNQSRLAVSFKRLLMPNGYSIELDTAPALNRAGETGLKDKVNNHRFRTFGLAGAIGLLGGFALYRNGPYLGGVANSTGSSATQAMSHYLNALPTITIREGHEVVVYIPDDLLVPEYKPLAGKE